MEEEDIICTYDVSYIYGEEGNSMGYAVVDGMPELYPEENVTFCYEQC